MSGKTKTLWQYLPDLILGEIMVMLMGLEKLQKCRQVCQKWNVMISQMTKNKKNIIWSKAESLATQIGDKWIGDYEPNVPEIIRLASMAHHGIPISVRRIHIHTELASAPIMHLASLASCVRGTILIQDVNCDLVPILLDNTKCWCLMINQTLGSEGTQALVRAMESNVENVSLGLNMRLDIAALTQYSGKGKCWMVTSRHINDGLDESRFMMEMWNWGRSMVNWETNSSSNNNASNANFFILYFTFLFYTVSPYIVSKENKYVY